MEIVIDHTMLKFFMEAMVSELQEQKSKFGDNILKCLIKDGTQFLRQGRNDIERWTLAVTEGEMSMANFVWLLRDKKHLAEMNALRKQGLTEERINELREEIIKIILNTMYQFSSGGLTINKKNKS